MIIPHKGPLQGKKHEAVYIVVVMEFSWTIHTGPKINLNNPELKSNYK